RLEEILAAPSETADGVPVTLRANLDQPHDTEQAVRVGADGVGLFRSEFLVIGHRTVPSEEEQYEAYREVVSAFPDRPVNLRTFDIGGDKLPEENPFLGWRAIRVCLDRPELFRRQLRAALRAGLHGNMRLMLPFVVSVSEVRRTREHLREVAAELEVEGEVGDVPLGVMVETPAAVETIDLLIPHVDFLSLGTNDLTQYTLAADRGNAKLSGIFDPLHPALVRRYSRLRRQVDEDECELSVCGELASDPVGVAVLLGLGYRTFSVPPATLPELKEVIRSVEVSELEQMTRPLEGRETAGEIRAPFERYLESVSSLPQTPTARLSQG
ncbi:MAG: putative PEP-binding protein, partial [Gemmatimonadota bacterium]